MLAYNIISVKLSVLKMKILNIMSSRILGGVEQVFVDYNEAFASKGHQVFAMYDKRGRIKGKLKNLDNIKYVPSLFIKPYFLSFLSFFVKVFIIKPDIIIVQSRKVISMFSLIGKILHIPVILVCHNPKTTLIKKADYLFSITEYQKNIFVKSGFPEDKIFVVPNFLSYKLPYKEIKEYSNPPIFGILGRFDPMKGFTTFIQACAKLNNSNIDFKAKIGGTPQKKYIDEYKKIKYLIDYYRLNKKVELLGWVENKTEFFNDIDIFVVPSKEEPFGIVLLEGMMYSKPIISSNAEGPNEILSGKNSALIFEAGDSSELAEKMKELLSNFELAKTLSKNAYDLVNNTYIAEKVASKLDDIVKSITNK